MKPSENEIKDAYALKEALRSKSQFRPDYSRDRFEQMLEEQRDCIKQSEFKHFTEMIQYIPEFRNKIPKSDRETATRLYNEYQKSVSTSTLITIPVTFFAFCNPYMHKLIGRSGTFILSISSTTMITLTNIMFFQQVYNREKIEKLTAICNQYKPLIRNESYLEFIQYVKFQPSCKTLLADDKVADRAYQLALEQLDYKKQGMLTQDMKTQFFVNLSKLKLESSEEFRQQYHEAQLKMQKIEKDKLASQQAKLLKQQQQQQLQNQNIEKQAK